MFIKQESHIVTRGYKGITVSVTSCHDGKAKIEEDIYLNIINIGYKHHGELSQQIWTPGQKWMPWSKSSSKYGPGNPYPLVNMGLWGSWSMDFGREFGPLAYFTIVSS
jgi:hypothetical protein